MRAKPEAVGKQKRESISTATKLAPVSVSHPCKVLLEGVQYVFTKLAPCLGSLQTPAVPETIAATVLLR